MTTSDSTLPDGDDVISLSVSVSEVTDIISRAKGAAGDPISAATRLSRHWAKMSRFLAALFGRRSPLVLFQSWVLCRI
jgi:hypothetical protein